MPSALSSFVELGPFHGTLATISKLTGSVRLESSLLKWLRPSRVRSRYGVTMQSNWSDATFNMCYFGAYGKTLSNLLRAETRPFVFLDIGANQGLYSLVAGKNPRCRAAIAFEPVPATFALLEANVAANGLGNVARPVNLAIASEAGSAVIRMSRDHSGGASMASSNPVAGEDITIHTINHRALDDIIPDGPEAILVKIDVEGLEPQVVAELVQSRHARRIDMLFYEIDEAWTDPGAIERALRGIGIGQFRKIASTPGATHYDVLATR